jgi:hypothetical protein
VASLTVMPRPPFHALIVPGPAGRRPGRVGAAEAEPHLPTEGE